MTPTYNQYLNNLSKYFIQETNWQKSCGILWTDLWNYIYFVLAASRKAFHERYNNRSQKMLFLPINFDCYLWCFTKWVTFRLSLKKIKSLPQLQMSQFWHKWTPLAIRECYTEHLKEIWHIYACYVELLLVLVWAKYAAIKILMGPGHAHSIPMLKQSYFILALVYIISI